MKYRPAPGHKLLCISGTLLFLLGILLSGVMLLLLMNLEGFTFGRSPLFRPELRTILEAFFADTLLTGAIISLFGVLGFRWSKSFSRSRLLIILGIATWPLLGKIAFLERLLESMQARAGGLHIPDVFYFSLLLPLFFVLGAYRNYQVLRDAAASNDTENDTMRDPAS